MNVIQIPLLALHDGGLGMTIKWVFCVSTPSIMQKRHFCHISAHINGNNV